MKQNIKKFFQNHGLDAEDINVDALLDDFRMEMDKGLAGKESSLKMIPTYISTDHNLPLNEPVIVIDAGGTNLRIALIHFDESAQVVVDEFSKYQMPGVEKEFSANEFFGTLAEYVRPVAAKSERIGFCFSYPAEISETRDGKLTCWTKGIKVPEVEGRYIGKGLIDALGSDGEGKKLTLLNDTIATLLAGKAKSGGKNYSSYVGLILGTGTNMAYIEHNSNITKLNNINTNDSQPINVESGNFKLAPCGDIDRALFANTPNPLTYMFEKMIAGLYRGDFILLVLKAGAREDLFSEPCAEYIMALNNLEGIHVDKFLKDSAEGPLAADVITDEDKETLRSVINGIYLRVAKLTAINISAAVLKSGTGTDPMQPVCVNIDGSTYYKSVGFKKMVETFLEQILGKRDIAYDLMHVDEAPLVGAAVAGLSDVS